jgi:hypothetical protein
MFIVIRSLTLFCLLFLVAGCGGSAKPEAAPRPASSSSLASHPGPPKPPRPKIAGVSDGPPAAWLETERGSFWLGYSSYCWGTACVDFIAPSCRDPKHTPRITLRLGERVTAHLAFNPTELGLSLLPRTSDRRDQREEAPTERAPTWVVRQPGPFSLFARAKNGDASYVACIRLPA